MPRIAARQLLALAAAARMPAASYAQLAASLWSSAISPTTCGQSCTCSRCVTSGSQHGLLCGCSSCRTRTAVLGTPTVPSGRMHLATLGDSQDKVDAINDRFTEAREEISIAHDDAETTYFDEAYQEAKQATTEVLTMFGDLLASLDEAERGKLQRSMGMKMEQLKAEMSQLDTLHD